MNKVQYLIFLFLNIVSNCQITEISDSDWYSSGNFLIKELTKNNINDIKGSPYTNPKYEQGEIIFSNGNRYNAYLRLNAGEQKFEIKNLKTSEIADFKLDENVKVRFNGDFYYLHSININGSNQIVIMEECYLGEKYSLFYFPKKVIEYPKKNRTPAPSSGFEKSELPSWKSYNSYVVKYLDKYFILPKSHGKMLDLNLAPKATYKKYRKENKLSLNNKESLIQFIKFLNKI